MNQTTMVSVCAFGQLAASDVRGGVARAFGVTPDVVHFIEEPRAVIAEATLALNVFHLEDGSCTAIEVAFDPSVTPPITRFELAKRLAHMMGVTMLAEPQEQRDALLGRWLLVEPDGQCWLVSERDESPEGDGIKIIEDRSTWIPVTDPPAFAD